MLVLQSGINTKKDFTFREKSTLGDYNYIIFFQSDHEARQYGCKLSDVSTFPTRYNRFTITVTTPANALNGEVTLYREGFYKYYAYEINDASLFNFSWVGELPFDVRQDTNYLQDYLEANHSFTGQLMFVEDGKMKYVGDATDIAYYANKRDPINSYNGG